jgi:hypothetical protein
MRVRTILLAHSLAMGLATTEQLGCGFLRMNQIDVTSADGEYQINMQSPPALISVDFSPPAEPRSVPHTSPSDFLANILAQRVILREDVRFAVEWADDHDPELESQLSLPNLRSLLESNVSLGGTSAPAASRMAEWRAMCLAARLMALGKGLDGALNAADPFYERHKRDIGLPLTDACMWEAVASLPCRSLQVAETLIRSSLYSPLYTGSDWSTLPVGATLPEGATVSPFDIIIDVPFNSESPTTFAAGSFANDFTLGGTFDASRYSAPGRLHKNDRAVNDAIHTVWPL